MASSGIIDFPKDLYCVSAMFSIVVSDVLFSFLQENENNKIIIEYFEPKKQLGKSKLLLKRIQIRPILSSNQRIEDCTTPCSPNIVLASSPDLYDNYNGPSFADTGIDLTQINTLKKAVGANCNSPQPQTQQL